MNVGSKRTGRPGLAGPQATLPFSARGPAEASSPSALALSGGPAGVRLPAVSLSVRPHLFPRSPQSSDTTNSVRSWKKKRLGYACRALLSAGARRPGPRPRTEGAGAKLSTAAAGPPSVPGGPTVALEPALADQAPVADDAHAGQAQLLLAKPHQLAQVLAPLVQERFSAREVDLLHAWRGRHRHVPSVSQRHAHRLRFRWPKSHFPHGTDVKRDFWRSSPPGTPVARPPAAWAHPRVERGGQQDKSLSARRVSPTLKGCAVT